jgi:hypothetical protein
MDCLAYSEGCVYMTVSELIDLMDEDGDCLISHEEQEDEE